MPFQPEDILPTLRKWFRRSWLLHWTLANMAGWSLGLMVAALLVSQFGLVGMALSGVAAGGTAGFIQGIALRTHPRWQPDLRGWTLISAGGGALATLPVYLPSFLTLLNLNLGLLVMGLIFGGIVGAMQFRVLQRDFDGAGWWILACLAGGAMCAPLSLSASSFWLPVFCSPGPLLFGLITGAAFLKKMTGEEEPEQ
jgi:hypothetical protein